MQPYCSTTSTSMLWKQQSTLTEAYDELCRVDLLFYFIMCGGTMLMIYL